MGDEPQPFAAAQHGVLVRAGTLPREPDGRVGRGASIRARDVPRRAETSAGRAFDSSRLAGLIPQVLWTGIVLQQSTGAAAADAVVHRAQQDRVDRRQRDFDVAGEERARRAGPRRQEGRNHQRVRREAKPALSAPAAQHPASRHPVGVQRESPHRRLPQERLGPDCAFRSTSASRLDQHLRATEGRERTANGAHRQRSAAVFPVAAAQL